MFNHHASHLLEQIADARLCDRHKKLIFSAVPSATDVKPSVVQRLHNLTAFCCPRNPFADEKKILKTLSPSLYP